MSPLALIPVIPLVPLAGFVAIGLSGKRLSRRAIAAVACGTVLVAFLLAVGAVGSLALGARDGEPGRYAVTVATWIPAGPFVSDRLGVGEGALRIDYGFAVDPLSAVMLLVVTGVGFLIHVYAVGYMAHEEGFGRFFAYLNLFMTMMLVLVLADNLLLMFVGWEGVGLCSYLLIGFFTDRMFDPRTGMTCSDAGRKAFLVNRIGDMAFLLGTLCLLIYFRTANFAELTSAIGAQAGPLAGSGLLTLAALLLFGGVAGKSAQIPLHVWLPDAMAGPTPVSALIHAATMVTAGVYLLARLSILYVNAPVAMLVVASVGAATALMAASIGLGQNDIKKVLAYSTVSQLGLMVMAAGVGAFTAAIFHLVTHAFFKACLFLGAGSVIHATGGEQDIRRMGGLREKMPWTFGTFLIAALALSGIPPLAGFFSKDEILASALMSEHGAWWLWAAGTVTAFLTALYMGRLVLLTFAGSFRGSDESAHHLHESPRVMTVPLAVLAVLATVGGALGLPRFLTGGAEANLIERWLERVVGGAHGITAARQALLALVATLVASAGLWLAWRLYGRSSERALAGIPMAEPGFEPVSGPKRWFGEALYLDRIYRAVVVAPFFALARGFAWCDQWIVDGAVNGVRNVTMGLSIASNANDRWVVDLAVNGVGAAFRVGSGALRRAQTGLVQNYAAVMVMGTFVLLTLYVIFR